jgi:ubiquinone/menaquinone biosynthesis C-methylase UbiE
MPVDVNLPKEGIIYQREQYRKCGIGRWYWDYRDEQILKLIEDKDTIVDIGCGEGILIEKLAEKFPRKTILGIDPSNENVDICKSHNLNVYPGNVYGLPLEDSSVECVLFIEVIEHLDGPELAIKEIKRVLKKDGSLILLFPHDRVFRLARILTLKFKEAFYDAGHVRQWNPNEIRRLLESAGFMTVSEKNIPFYLWSISLHCLVEARKI